MSLDQIVKSFDSSLYRATTKELTPMRLFLYSLLKSSACLYGFCLLAMGGVRTNRWLSSSIESIEAEMARKDCGSMADYNPVTATTSSRDGNEYMNSAPNAILLRFDFVC